MGAAGMNIEDQVFPKRCGHLVGKEVIPVASTMVAHRALSGFFGALRASATGVLSDRSDLVSGFDEVTDFLGLPAYRVMEDTYLPQSRLAEKYR
jgi:hypothetical protein